MCSYPNCKGEPIITLAYADSIRLCEKHWEQCCAIELEDNATIAQCIAHERKQLQFHRRCGSEGAAKALKKLAADRENYVFKSISIRDGEYVTIAEHRKYLAAKAEEAADAAETEELFETEPDEESADEADDDEEENFFGEF